MIVKGELEEAQLECVASDAQERRGRIKYNVTDQSVNVGTGLALPNKKLFPLDVATLAEFRSAMYPIGSMLYNKLAQSSFDIQMGSGLWVEAGLLAFSSESGKEDSVQLVPTSTGLGAALKIDGYIIENYTPLSDDDFYGNVADAPFECVQVASIAGRYLRSSGKTLGSDITTVVDNNITLAEEVKEHSHQKTFLTGQLQRDTDGQNWLNNGLGAAYDDFRIGQETASLDTGYGQEVPAAANVSISVGNVVTYGGSETRPETTTCNLYLKVN